MKIQRKREMKVERVQIEYYSLVGSADESAIGCAVSCNTIAKGSLPPSHAGDIERICRELRKVQSAEKKPVDKTRSEPPGGEEGDSERELGKRGGKNGEREMYMGTKGRAWAYRSNYRVVRYGFMQIRQKCRGSFRINGGRTNVSRFFC